MTNKAETEAPERIWLGSYDGKSWESHGCWSPRPFPDGSVEQHAYVRQDIADERVKQARKEVWDAAIVEVDRLPAFNDQKLLRLTLEYERDSKPRNAAEGEG